MYKEIVLAIVINYSSDHKQDFYTSFCIKLINHARLSSQRKGDSERNKILMLQYAP